MKEVTLTHTHAHTISHTHNLTHTHPHTITYTHSHSLTLTLFSSRLISQAGTKADGEGPDIDGTTIGQMLEGGLKADAVVDILEEQVCGRVLW